jgi:O-antigen ligase
MWALEFVWILGALALPYAHLAQGMWFPLGLLLLGLSFAQRWVVTGRPTRLTTFDAPWALLLAGALVGSWASYDLGLSLPVLLSLAGCTALYYAAANAPRPAVLAQAALLLGAGAAAYFLIQYRYVVPAEKSPLAFALGELISGPFPRIGAWEPFPNGVATLLEGLIPLGVGLAIVGPSRTVRIANGLLTGVLAVATLATASRGAWVALVVAGAIWLASRRRPGLLVLGMVAALAVGATLADLPLVGQTLRQLFVRPDRLYIFRGSLYLIRDYAFTGIGLGDVFGRMYSRYVLLIPYVFLNYAHNLYLTVWLEQGLLGAMGIVWLVAAFLVLVVRRTRVGESSALFQAVWVGVMVVLVHGLFDARQYMDLWSMWPLYLLLGLVVSLCPARSRPRANVRAWRWAALALVPMIGSGLLLWRPLGAAALANLGAVRQTRAELREGLGDDVRATYLQAAAASYGRALDLEPRNLTANLRLGVLAMDAGRYQEAVSYLQAASEVGPNDPAVRKALGLVYVWVGRLDQAELLLVGVPEIAKELNTWGWWWGQQGKDTLAQNAYRMATRLDTADR